MGEGLVALVTLLGITVLVLAYVLQPIWKARMAQSVSSTRLALEIQYERVLGMLRDLETDWRTGKIPDEDYHELRQRYLEEGAALLRALREGEETIDWEARVEAAVQARRAQLRRKSA